MLGMRPTRPAPETRGAFGGLVGDRRLRRVRDGRRLGKVECIMLQCQPGRLPHVLVADDQPSIHEIVREELEPGRYRVSAASDGREAMRLLEADRPGLLVVDAVLPVIPGIEVAAHAV